MSKILPPISSLNLLDLEGAIIFGTPSRSLTPPRKLGTPLPGAGRGEDHYLTKKFMVGAAFWRRKPIPVRQQDSSASLRTGLDPTPTRFGILGTEEREAEEPYQ